MDSFRLEDCGSMLHQLSRVKETTGMLQVVSPDSPLAGFSSSTRGRPGDSGAHAGKSLILPFSY